ncbi:unnamed protein product [Malus baccata var. baccata]
MEGSSNSHSRNRKTREMPLRQVVLALAAPSALPPPHLRSATTKRAGRRDKPKEVVLAHSAPNAPPPQVHPTTKRAGTIEKPREVVLNMCAPNAPPSPLQTTTKRAGTRDKEEEVALTLSLPNAPPPQLNITTAATNDGTKSDYSLRQKRKQVERAAAPDPTEFSSDDDYTPPVTNGRKQKEVEIVHEIIKDQKNQEKLVGENIVIKKEIGSSFSCGEKVKKSLSTSSTAGKKETKRKEKKKKETKKKTTEVVDVLYDTPGEIPDLDLLEKKYHIHGLSYTFFDGIPED